jgi:hypothetical protein
MEPALWPAFHCRHFSKKAGSIQWLESALFRRPPMHWLTPRFAERPLCAAGSTDRCNTFRELVCWGLIEQGLSGPFIEPPCYRAASKITVISNTDH